MEIIEDLRRHLSATMFIVRKWSWVFLQDEDDVPHWSLIKWLHRVLLMQDVLWHPGKEHWHDYVPVEKMTS